VSGQWRDDDKRADVNGRIHRKTDSQEPGVRIPCSAQSDHSQVLLRHFFLLLGMASATLAKADMDMPSETDKVFDRVLTSIAELRQRDQ